MKPDFLIVSTKRILSCQTEGFILFKTMPLFSDAKKCRENTGNLFIEKEWKKCFPLSCSGLEPASVTEEVLALLPCLKGMRKSFPFHRRTLYSPNPELVNLMSFSSDIKSLLVNIHWN